VKTTPSVEQAPSRVQRKRGRRIQEILRTAAELFGERGYEAVTVEQVADQLDVTKGSIYYYFPSKDELGTAAIETVAARLDRAPRAATRGPHRPGEPAAARAHPRAGNPNRHPPWPHLSSATRTPPPGNRRLPVHGHFRRAGVPIPRRTG
jgi:AcrR family transcriptional regulator